MGSWKNRLVLLAMVLCGSGSLSAQNVPRVLILGDGELARDLVTMTRSRAHLGYIYLGFLDARGEGDPSPSDERIGHYDEVSEAVRRTQATLVVVAMADRRGRRPVTE